MYKVALVGDIEKAFLMVGVSERDIDVLRFLWFEDPFLSPPRIIKYRFTLVVFGVSASPFLLNATIRHHVMKYEETDPEFVSRFLHGIYVDDLTSGGEDEDDYYHFYVKSKMRLLEAGFNLRKFASNSSILRDKIAENEDSKVVSSMSQRVLGVLWNPTEDQLVFDITPVIDILAKLNPTKRNVVGASARIHDPLGVLSPITVRFKIFFQQLCSVKLGWDEQVIGELRCQWQALISSLKGLQQVMIPRHPHQIDASHSLQLVGFCDASQRAYAAVVYLKTTTSTGTTLSILAAKTRVAPLKTVTIPRLELLSALLLARLVKTVSDSLLTQLEPPTCFTDSLIALCWIRHVEKEWKQFVENRVSEIRTLVPPECWHHCPGNKNPADLPSRGMTAVEYSHSLDFWINGPDWFDSSEYDISDPLPKECLSEERNSDLILHATCAEVSVPRIIDVEKFSSLKRLLGVTARVFQFIRLVRSREGTGVSTTDMARAYNFIIRTAQVTLEQNENFKLWARQFGLFKDDQGIWKCKGRLANADLPEETKHPIFLERNALATLIVRDCHERVRHSAVSITLAELRSRYWIVKGRQLVKQIVHSCVTCRRFQSKPYQTPPSPPLPVLRVDMSPPFTYKGVDFAGPLYVREKLSSAACKAWICLYTCCVSRAVHIELVTEMTAAAFLRSFKRFTSRRGLPRRILSDNAKTFKAADKIISAIMAHPHTQHYFLDSGISWQYNVERAPWWGGVFERMIQSAKRIIRKVIGTAKFTLDEMATAVIEVESILNSRPLTHFSSEEMIEPLTPSHLICGRRIAGLPNIPVEDDDYNSQDDIGSGKLTRRMNHLMGTIESLWQRWRREYLLELRNDHRYHTGGNVSSQPSIRLGDVVLVGDDNVPRGFWQLATVVDLLTGQDGEVRAAAIRTHTKGGRVIRLKRPIQKLYPLEVNDPTTATMLPTGDASTQNDSSPVTECIAPVRNQARRAAAEKARRHFCENLSYDSDV